VSQLDRVVDVAERVELLREARVHAALDVRRALAVDLLRPSAVPSYACSVSRTRSARDSRGSHSSSPVTVTVVLRSSISSRMGSGRGVVVMHTRG
jgi:hypothetical protein